MKDTKMILLIGRSGRGKSTLANVLTSTNDFKESSSSVSETKKIQLGNFKENNTNYAIIDTPGIGDTKMSDHEVLDIIAEAVYLARNGVSQVFFVTNGRFDQYEMATYDLLRTIIFDSDITKNTTIVRTRFIEFKDKEKCQADIDLMVKEAQEKKVELEKDVFTKKGELANLSSDSKQYQDLLRKIEDLKKELTSTNLAEIIESCQTKAVYVDNPPLRITVPDGADDEDREDIEVEINSNKIKRNESRKILLNHLNKYYQESPYKPTKLAQLSKEIADDYFQYLKKDEELQKELDSLKSEEAAELTAKGEKEQAESGGNIGIIDPKESIAQLQDKKERLQKEIQEKKKIIRQKVLKHIFNNYQEISQELGGNIFLNSVSGDYDWSEIDPKFTNQELVVKWLSKGFNYQQTRDWAVALEEDFQPEIDAEFCTWLRDKKQLTVKKVKELSHIIDVKQLRNEYRQQLEKEVEICYQRSQCFRNLWKHEEDSRLIEIIESCKSIIYTDNSPLIPEKDKEDRDSRRKSSRQKLLKYLQENCQEIYEPKEKEEIEKSNSLTKNILLIGMTGNGKSTLANVLSESDEFKESEFGSASETQEIQVEGSSFSQENNKEELLAKVNEYLANKKSFLDSRQEAIKDLQKSLEGIKPKLNKELSEQEIGNLLQEREEIVQLELKLKELRQQREVNQKPGHYSGTFHEVVYGGDIKAGDYANFGRVGVQNFEDQEEEKKSIGKYAGWSVEGDAVGIGGNNQGNIFHISNRKTCKVCHQEVGIDHQNNCQCEREDNYCGYCEENEVSRKNCTCRKETSNSVYSGSFSGFFTGGIGNTGPVSGPQTANVHKYCANLPHCSQKVTHIPNNCACWHGGKVCTYCWGNDDSVTNCICLEEWKKKNQKAKSSSSQVKVEQNQQQPQILQPTNQPYGTPSSSK